MLTKKLSLLLAGVLVLSMSACDSGEVSQIISSLIPNQSSSVMESSSVEESSNSEESMSENESSNEEESSSSETSSSEFPQESGSSSSVSIHVHDYEWKYDHEFHWQEATCHPDVQENYGSHTYKEVVNEQPTFEHEGSASLVCEVCGYVGDSRTIPPLQHNYEDEYSYDEDYHYHKCTDEGFEDVHTPSEPHDFSIHEYEATYDEEGRTTYECSVCGYSYEIERTDKLKYKVTWLDANSNVSLVEEYYKGETPAVSFVPQKESKYVYYEFIGWNPKIKPITSDVTYTPQFKATVKPEVNYTISFNPNGGENAPESVYAIEDDEICYIPDGKPTKDGYVFMGWNSFKTGNNIYLPEDKIDHIDTYSFYAMWVPECDVCHGTGTIADSDEACEECGGNGYILEEGPDIKTVKSDSITIVFKKGFEYSIDNGLTWVRSALFSNLNPNSTYQIIHRRRSDDTTPFGYPSAPSIVKTSKEGTYTITYELNGGDNNSNNPKTYTYPGGYITLYKPTRSNCTFDGWYYNDEKVADIDTSWCENIVLEARWSPIQYNIEYDLDGGELPAETENPTSYNVDTETFTLINPTKPEHQFVGWVCSDGADPVKNVVVEKGITGDLYFKAVFERELVNLVYVLNDGVFEGGKNPNPTVYYFKDGSVDLIAPSKEHYEFKYWLSGSTKYYSSLYGYFTGTDTLTLEAIFEPESFSITYNLDGGTSDNKDNYTFFDDSFTLNNPVKKGYTFVGWIGSNGDTPSKDVTIPSGSTGELQYEAVWAIDTYNVQYELNGGSLEKDNPSTYTVLDDVTLTNPTKAHYTFDGWYLEETFETKIDSFAGYAQDLKLYAKFNPDIFVSSYDFDEGETYYTITVDLCNEGMTNFEVKLNKGESFDLFSLPYDETKGYLFEGLYFDKDYNNEITSDFEVGKDMTIYVKWSEDTNNVAQYIAEKVTSINTNDTSDRSRDSQSLYVSKLYTGEATFTYRLDTQFRYNDGTQNWYLSTSSYPYQTTVNVYLYEYLNNDYVGTIESKTIEYYSASKSFDTVLKPGYKYTVSTYSGTYKYYDSALRKNFKATGLSEGTITLTKKRSLFATWASTCEQAYGIETIIPQNVSRNGYTLLGWYTDNDEKVHDIWDYDQDMTLHAKWEKNIHTITYDLNGGNVDGTNPSEYSVTDTISLIAPTKDYYNFVGWCYQDQIYDNLDVTWDSDLELEAVWTPIKYDIIYNLNGGTVKQTNPTSYNIETSDFTLNNPTKAGYRFLGWTTEEVSEPNDNFVIQKGSHGDLIITANFELINYNITYVLSGGVNSAKNYSTYTVFDAFELKDATKTGYTFNGWYLDSAFTNNITAISTGTTGDLTIYAKYTPITYHATFIDYEGVYSNTKITLTLVNNNGTANTVKVLSSGATYDLYASGNYPTKKNYAFEGWYLDQGFTQKVTGDYVITCDTTLYAHFIYNNTSYTYLTSGASISASGGESHTYYYVIPDNVISINYYWKATGYISWSNYGSSSSGRWGSASANGHGKTVTANIDYNRNNGSATKTDSGSGVDNVTPGQIVSIYAAGYSGNASISINEKQTGRIKVSLDTRTKDFNYDSQLKNNTPTPTRSGYTFGGWKDANGNIIGDVWKYTADQTFTSVWKPVAYNISYNLDGGTNSKNNPSTYTKTDNIVLDDATKKGHTFAGWYLDTGFTNQITTIDDRTGDLTLYAKFVVNNYDFNLDFDGGTYSPTITFYDGNIVVKEVTLSNLSTFDYFRPENSDPNKIFAGWYKEPELKTLFDFNTTYSKDQKVYAKWVDRDDSLSMLPGENIVIDLNGQNPIYIVICSPYNQMVTISSASSYDLVGELLDQNNSVLVSNDDISDTNLNFGFSYSLLAGKKYLIKVYSHQASATGKATISATGKANPGTHITGGTVSSYHDTVTFGKSFILPAGAYREGYNFLGWFDSADKLVNTSSWTYDSEQTFVAKWEAI